MRAGRTLYGVKIDAPRDFFLAVDQDKTGRVKKSELRPALARLDVTLSVGTRSLYMNAVVQATPARP
eukprot:SAG11_NODE_1765_length_4285_cov_3.009795_4_plen_67_part_00